MAIIVIEIILSIYFCVKESNYFFNRIKIISKFDFNDIKNNNIISNININNIQNATQKNNKSNKKQSIKGNNKSRF